MRVALLADIHGNAVALEACLAVLDRLDVETVYFLGDAVGYMPDEVEVLRSLRERGIVCQQGNHEAMLLDPDDERARAGDDVYRLRAAADRLSGDELRHLQAWPRRRELDLGERRVLLVHGSPTDELFDYVYPDSATTWVDGLPFDAVFTANTHRPFVRERAGKLVVNVGSVGLPRDHGGLSAFAVYDTEAHTCRVVRVPLDVVRVVERYGEALHESVVACLSRTASDDVVGEVVP